jgi:hypothetical protein
MECVANAWRNVWGVTLNPAGTVLYTAEYNNNAVRSVTLASGAVATLAGGGTAYGTNAGYANAVGRMAVFNQPFSLSADASGNVFVADRANNLVRKIVAATGVTTVLAGGRGGTALPRRAGRLLRQRGRHPRRAAKRTRRASVAAAHWSRRGVVVLLWLRRDAGPGEGA